MPSTDTPNTVDALHARIAREPALALWFGSPECSVCPVLEMRTQTLFAQQLPRLAFHSIDARQSPATAAQFGVFAVPTLIVYFDGRETLRHARNFSPAQLVEALSRAYAMRFETGYD